MSGLIEYHRGRFEAAAWEFENYATTELPEELTLTATDGAVHVFHLPRARFLPTVPWEISAPDGPLSNLRAILVPPEESNDCGPSNPVQVLIEPQNRPATPRKPLQRPQST